LHWSTSRRWALLTLLTLLPCRSGHPFKEAIQ
jgi:hypothetical protein